MKTLLVKYLTRYADADRMILEIGKQYPSTLLF